MFYLESAVETAGIVPIPQQEAGEDVINGKNQQENSVQGQV